MQISDNSVVNFHYSLANEQGQLIESSEGSQPVAYLHGHGQIIPGLESAMHGKNSGDNFSVQLAPEHAYGPRTEGLVERLPRQAFDPETELTSGMTCVAHTQEGDLEVNVVGFEGDQVLVDANHPLAGMTLTFDIQVTHVRAATDEEVSHGHAHGPDGANG